MKWKDYWDCPEEIVICGIMSTIPIYWIIGWWAIPLCVINGLMWRWGGAKGGWKPARWALVPLIIVTVSFLFTHHWQIFLAAPFMVKLMPFSYGKSGWLYKWLKNDLPVRLVCFSWYWLMFSLAFILTP